MEKTTVPTLPAPKYTVTDPRGSHRYQINIPDGRVFKGLKSVTGVLDVINKPALVNWAARTAAENIEAALRARLNGEESRQIVMTADWITQVIEDGKRRPDDIKKEAGNLGTLLHDAFDRILQGLEPPPVPPEGQEALSEFRKWFAASGIIMVGREMPVASLDYLFGGRLDGLGYKGGGWGVIDYKTGSGIYPEHALQTAGGYAIALEEMYGIQIDWVDIVRFSKKAPWGSEAKPVLDIALAKQGFLEAKRLGEILKSPLLGSATYRTFLARKTEALDVESRGRITQKIMNGQVPF